jgi:hypothetical protein
MRCARRSADRGARHRLMLYAFTAAAMLIAPAVDAFTPTLSDQDIETARRSGATQADSRTHGYTVEDYVLYDAKQPLSEPPRKQEVEAVVLGTPFERLRYASYLASIQGRPMTAAQAQEAARKLEGTLHIVVFAHSPAATNADRSFLQRYREVVLQLEDGRSVRPQTHDIFGPAQDFFSVQGSGRERRWLGTLTWGFPLAPSAQETAQSKARLSFVDSSGTPYSFTVELGRYK